MWRGGLRLDQYVLAVSKDSSLYLARGLALEKQLKT